MKMAHTSVTVEEVVKCSQIPKLFWIEGDIAKSKKNIWVWSVINSLAGFSEAWRSGVRHVHKHLIVGTKYKDFVPYINSHQKQYLIEDEVNNWVENNALTICPQPAIFIDHHRTDKMSQKGIAKVIEMETIPGPSSIKHTYVQPPSNSELCFDRLVESLLHGNPSLLESICSHRSRHLFQVCCFHFCPQSFKKFSE